MSDIELDNTSDQEVSESHSKLLQSVKKLDKAQRVTKAARSEPTLAVSEFHLVKSGVTDKDVVNVNDLVKSLPGKSHHRAINQKVQKSKRMCQVLEKPLEKPAADKLKRQVVFEHVKKDLHKWDPITEKNRAADTLHFPLNEPSMRMQKTEDFAKRFRVESELERELAALEPKKVEPVEKVDEFPLTLAEMREKRSETAKFRVQQSHQAAKARRQNKIKSKKYHRIQRKALTKQKLKEFEELEKTDPEAALAKLEQLDKVRAEERMSLRHKNSGQWAKNKMIRAKYDKDSRKDLAQQLAIGRELTQQLQKNESDDEEYEDNNGDLVEEADKENPFFKKTSSEVDAFVAEYRKFSDARDKKEKEKEEKLEENFTVPAIEIPDSFNPVESVLEEAPNHQETPEKMTKKVSKKQKKNSNPKKRKVGTTDWSVEELTAEEKPVKNSKILNIETMFSDMEAERQKKINEKINKIKRKLTKDVKKRIPDEKEKETHEEYHDLSMKKKKMRPEFDGALNETVGDVDADAEVKTREINSNELMIEKESSENKLDKKKKVEIDPTKFIAVKPKHLKTMLPDDVTGGEGLDDSEDDENAGKDQFNIISEAFADDNVVEDFAKEKQEEIKKSQPEDINMILPGWGSWTGQNIKVPKRKKARFILKLPKDGPRKDENKGDVIIIEGGNEKIRKHLVSNLPYPFESVADFEASIRAPIGRDFVPEKAHKQLTEPAIKTKMGRIIEPMTEESLIQKDMKIRGKIPESILLKKKIKKDENKNKKLNNKSNKKNNSIVKKNK